jgi:bifunctional non-homologous end joining protein LigD
VRLVRSCGVLGVRAQRSSGAVIVHWKPAAGSVGEQIGQMEVPKPLFAAGASKPGRWSKRAPGSERWVRPELVAEVNFAEWTPDGEIRPASFVALRSDKPAKAIVRETAKALDAGVPWRLPGQQAQAA